MTRLFEIRAPAGKGETQIIVDLDKVCSVRVEKSGGQQYPGVLVRFVGGNEVRDAVPPELAQKFVDAFRAHLKDAK